MGEAHQGKDHLEELDWWSGPKMGEAHQGKDHLEELDWWSGPAKFVKIEKREGSDEAAL